MYPANLALPMAAPRDLGRAAADRLLSPIADTGVHAEGPTRCPSNDVAQAFAEVLGRPVEVVVTPREQWERPFARSAFRNPPPIFMPGSRRSVSTADSITDERLIRGLANEIWI